MSKVYTFVGNEKRVVGFLGIKEKRFRPGVPVMFTEEQFAVLKTKQAFLERIKDGRITDVDSVFGNRAALNVRPAVAPQPTTLNFAKAEEFLATNPTKTQIVEFLRAEEGKDLGALKQRFLDALQAAPS